MAYLHTFNFGKHYDVKVFKISYGIRLKYICKAFAKYLLAYFKFGIVDNFYRVVLIIFFYTFEYLRDKRNVKIIPFYFNVIVDY